MSQNNGALINQASGKADWITPPYVLDAARKTMGNIDLDPASSAYANENFVQASAYFDAAGDGLAHPWFGNVWLNWPYGRQENKLWTDRLITAYRSHEIDQACCICWTSTAENWYKRLLDFPHVLLYKRVAFIDPRTGNPVRGSPRGSALFYLGKDICCFAMATQAIGRLCMSATAFVSSPRNGAAMYMAHCYGQEE